jgi:hypothetical protein
MPPAGMDRAFPHVISIRAQVNRGNLLSSGSFASRQCSGERLQIGIDADRLTGDGPASR